MAAALPLVALRRQDALRNDLMAAIRKDDGGKIEQLVRSGAPLHQHYHHTDYVLRTVEPHVRDTLLVNPVDWAALEMRFRAAMQLLELADEIRHGLAEARPRPPVYEHINVAGETRVALCKAAELGHLGFLKMLLERGASVEQKNAEGFSALYCAVKNRQSEAVTLLLQFQALDCEERRDEVTAMALERGMVSLFGQAAQAAQGVTVRSLTTPSTRPSTSPSVLGTPSAGARRAHLLEHGHTNAITHKAPAARGAKSDGLVSWGWASLRSPPGTPLAAAGGGIVSHGAPVYSAVAEHTLSANESRLRGELRAAIKLGNIDKLNGLIARGAPLECKFDLGYGAQGNCVDWACVCGKPEVALVLLKHGDDRGIGDLLAVEAHAGFFWSVSQGHLEVLRDLLRRGADVGQRSKVKGLEEPETALLVAVTGSRREEMAELLRYGAWERETEAARKTLLEMATRRRFAAQAFHAAGIGDFEAQLAPLELPYKEHGVWGPSYPPPEPVHWETPFAVEPN